MKTVKLGDVCEFKPAKSKARTILSDTDEVTFVPMEQLSINKKYFTGSQTKKLAKVYSSYVYFQNDDIIYAKITPCFENGKMGIAKNLKNSIGFGSSEYVPVRCSGSILPEYVYYFLLKPDFIANGRDNMRGASGHKRVPDDYVKNLDIPLPSIEEQRRVVERLDAAFEKIDRAIDLTNTARAKTKQIFEKELSDTFKNLNPTWTQGRLDSFCTLQRGHDLPKQLRKAGKYQIASSSGTIDTHNQYKAKGPGVFTGRSGSIGNVFYIENDFWPLNTVLYVKEFNNNNPKLIYYLIKSLDFKNYAGGTGVPTLNRNNVHSISVSLPAKQEQQIVVDKLDRLLSSTGDLQAQYGRKLHKLQSLKQSMLQQAFSGDGVQ